MCIPSCSNETSLSMIWFIKNQTGKVAKARASAKILGVLWFICQSAGEENSCYIINTCVPVYKLQHIQLIDASKL